MSVFLYLIFPYITFFIPFIITLSITFFYSSNLDKKTRFLLLSQTFFYTIFVKFIAFLAHYCNESNIFF